MSSGLRHSQSALYTRQRFLENANDFNLYVEDQGYEFWYKQIFKRMGYQIVSVVASGDKNKVVEDYRKYGQSTDAGKLNFYITDGDFWRYKCPEKMIKDDHFIYLETYNIESYFIDQDYSIQFLKGRLHTDDEGVAESGFDFDKWKQHIIDESNALFFVYATIESLTADLGETNPQLSKDIGSTVSNANKFLDFNTGFVKKDALREELDRIGKIVDSHNLSDNFSQTMQNIKESYYSINHEDYYNIVCGKYLVKGLLAYIKSILKSKSANLTVYEDDFKWGCINSFDISKLDYIKMRIESKLSA
ncbi:DUF4435 domain-containing protein [Streptococcus anginosus]|uniref:DUF4435 domain-containing protein n=1 Tax=Streptococcus anginosus TaxID=1328 RepID=UPI00189B4484|nr:DUF4435 domain-containing protein [Streptococcus anginosus]MDB8658234.1 DUF4435 domain-containing protein [Streptococcus anginosus]MDX5016216.1 DUF4435 domain-containing protein [Streptococcus anginosus]MDX5020249.1 DUF4435 domain-containing protein [Streptococcus anginosus]